jgi:ABC-type polar amino acid transport system ATPase subunit
MIIAKHLLVRVKEHSSQKKIVILDDVSFSILDKRITCFIGRSGAGKTSLLKAIGGLYPYEGSIKIEGVELNTLTPQERGQRLGFVFQQFNLFPHMTALENCTHPLKNLHLVSSQQAEKIARQKLALLGVESFADRYPSQLSGGQQQRVAIARALSLSPKLLLFDEPTSSLDPHSSATLQGIIKQLVSEGITIAFSSHDMNFVRGLLDCVYFMEHGKIIEQYDIKTELMPEKIKSFLANEVVIV